jgi:hypothetical protein
MTQEERKLIELLEFHVNDKAKDASKMMNQKKLKHEIRFYHGQYTAFNEIYSMLQNLKRTL